MLVIIKLLIFCISTIGSWELIRRKTDVNVHFLPGLTIAIQTVILFFGGLFNLLPEFTYILYGVGLIGFVYSIYKDKGFNFLRCYCSTGFIFVAIVMCVMMIYLKGKLFASYDNFSHWGLVVKRMLEMNRYPGYNDRIILFKEYPLGSSTYIYYFAKLVSVSESVQMLAQVYMMLVSILPVFYVSSKNKIANLAIILSATNFVMVYSVAITSLLVDTLLPLVAMSGLLYSYFYCRKDSKLIHLLFVSFYLVQIIQIKNSGIFFVILISIYILKNMSKGRDTYKRILCVIMPFISVILWQKHCEYLFGNGVVKSKHAMTVENYTAVFSNKTPDSIETICTKMLQFSIVWKDVWLTIAFLLVVGILIHFLAKKERQNYKKLVILSAVMYVTWQLGTLGMYLFSMPVGEAVLLSASERYTKTILIAILYLTLVLVVNVISKLELKKISIVFIASALFVSYFVFMFVSKGSIRTAIQYTEDPSIRDWMNSVKIEYAIPDEQRCCILVPERIDYFHYMGRYVFGTSDMRTLTISTMESMNSINSKYIIIYDDENEIIQEWVKENYPEHYGEKVIVKELEE